MLDLDERTSAKPLASTTPWALENLPPFPVVAARLMTALSDEDVNITEAGKLIASDPVFASRVLQMANSPLFALQRQVKTISHAIVVLGLQRVKVITVTRALGDFVTPVLKVNALRLCWRNSLAGAILSEKLAPACRLDPDSAYVAGLLRDIGRLALLAKYPESYANLLVVSGEHAYDLMTTERDLFDVDHCQAGAWMMERMSLPAELSEVVAHHHDALSEDALSEPFRMVHLVRIADLMADALGFAVVTPIQPVSFEEVLHQLPELALLRFRHDPEQLKTEIDTKIQAWD